MTPPGGSNITLHFSIPGECWDGGVWFVAGSAARAGRRPPSLRFDVRLRSVFSGQRGASDAEDEDEHPERLGAQVRLKYSNTRLFVLCFLWCISKPQLFFHDITFKHTLCSLWDVSWVSECSTEGANNEKREKTFIILWQISYMLRYVTAISFIVFLLVPLTADRPHTLCSSRRPSKLF